MRRVHRLVAVFAVFFGLYASLTGLTLQSIDLAALIGRAPPTAPVMIAMREGADGPPNFIVRTTGDFATRPLPQGFDYERALARVTGSARAVAGGAPLSFVELRMDGDRPVGQVASQGRLLRFDALSGAVLAGPADAPALKLPSSGGQKSLRNTVKNIHRMLAYGDIGTTSFTLIALAMCVMVVTGLAMYFRMLSARAKIGRRGLYWSGGEWWRRLHRAVAVTAALWLVVVMFSGTLLAIGTTGVAINRIANHGTRPGLTVDVSGPLSDGQLGPMLRTTLGAFRAAHPAAPIKVVRLRLFAGMPQGVVVAESGKETLQYAFNAATGGPAWLFERGYPATGQPFGWQEDQFVKGIHRGDAFGMLGRWLSLATGVSLLFLSVSGGLMYLDLWARRRRAGKRGLFW